MRKIGQQRYDQLYSLQLAMDKDGSFSKLPEKMEDIYQQRLPIQTAPITPQGSSKPSPYQQVPSGGAQQPAAVTTPVAIEPVIQQQALPPAMPQPRQDVQKTKNTVTTTTIRSAP